MYAYSKYAHMARAQFSASKLEKRNHRGLGDAFTGRWSSRSWETLNIAFSAGGLAGFLTIDAPLSRGQCKQVPWVGTFPLVLGGGEKSKGDLKFYDLSEIGQWASQPWKIMPNQVLLGCRYLGNLHWNGGCQRRGECMSRSMCETSYNRERGAGGMSRNCPTSRHLPSARAESRPSPDLLTSAGQWAAVGCAYGRLCRALLNLRGRSTLGVQYVVCCWF